MGVAEFGIHIFAIVNYIDKNKVLCNLFHKIINNNLYIHI